MPKIIIYDEVDVRNITEDWECYKRERNICFVRKEIDPLRLSTLSSSQKEALSIKDDPLIVYQEIYPFSMAHNFGGPFFEHYGLLLISHEFDFKRNSTTRKGQKYERVLTGKFIVTLAGNDDRIWLLRGQTKEQYEEIIKFFELMSEAPYVHEFTNKFKMEGI